MEYMTKKSTNNISDLSPIQEFYSNTNIFVTGGTGFYGKILIEKLLRSCPTVGKIYVLIRSKPGMDSKTRLMGIFDDVLFERLKKECPNFCSKVAEISGDLHSPGLGISNEDRELLVKETHIIFHVGASVKFNEGFSRAILTNSRSTRDIVELAHQMPNLKAMMHVSTAYSHCIYDVIEERIYPPMYDGKALICLAENLPEHIVNGMKHEILKDYPNSYVFTKHIAEAIILQNSCDLPIGIQRPAIVVSTYKEPIKSWINNIYGPTGVVVNANLGLLRVVQGDCRNKANLVPADMAVNSLIASAWDVGVTFQKAKNENKSYELQIYNYESDNDKPLTWFDFFDKAKEYSYQYPSVKAKWFYSLHLVHRYAVFVLLKFLLHTLPAIIFDIALICGGKQPKMVKINSKINKLCEVLAYFPLRKWTFTSNNVRRLLNQMSDMDKKIFFFDLKLLDWDEFLQNYVIGLRLYILKESMESLPDARERWKRLYWAHQFIKVVVGISLLGIIWRGTLLLFTGAHQKDDLFMLTTP